MKKKKNYYSPKVEMVKLDKRISIQLSSTPPGDPPTPIRKEGNGDNNPFK